MATTFFIVTFLAILLLWLYMKWLSVKTYWAQRRVKYLPPHPILGNLTFLLRQNSGLWLKEIYNQFRGSPYSGIWMFWKPALIVSCPDLARKILVKDSNNFRDRHISSGASDPIGSLNIFTVKDPAWSSMRKRLSVIFTSAKLRNLQPFVQLKSKELLQRFEMEKGNKKELRTMLADFTTDIIGTSAFGIENNATLTGEGPLRTVTKDFMRFSIYRGISWCCIFFLPEVVNFCRFSFFSKTSTDYFRKVYKSIVAQRESHDYKTEHNDLLDALLRIKKEGALDGEEFSDDFLIAQAAILLQGGFDTTAVMLTYLFLELAFNQPIQDKLYAELAEAEQKHGKDVFDSSVLLNLKYLNCVIKEALRKYPAMPWIDRIAKDNYKVDDNLTIAAGTPVLVNVIGMHYDEQYFPEPDKFYPDRFLPENEDKIIPYTYMPFGDGPRICIGLRFAQMSLTNVLTTVLLKFKVVPYPDTPSPSKMSVETRTMFYMPGEGVYLNFVPRL